MNQKPRSSNKSAISKFFSTKVKIAQPAPKFSIGDYIINTKYKVISKIIDITNVFDNEDRTTNWDVAEYVMVDIKNDARDALMATQNYEGITVKIVQRNYKRRKYVRMIDPFYNKINPAAAQALYGIKVTGDTNDDTDR